MAAPERDGPSFVGRLECPDGADGSVLVLLHGTGGDEADLLPLGRRLAPAAALLGVRGRSTEEGARRWFRRLDMTRFDQADVRAEADAFAVWLPGALAQAGLDAAAATFAGYSNGANFIAALMLLHPDLIRRAILLRPMLVLEAPPRPDLSDAAVLMVAGASDPYGRFAPALEKVLRDGGAAVDTHTIPSGHDIGAQDQALAQTWLGRHAAVPQPPQTASAP